MGLFSGSSGTQTTTQDSEPWGPQGRHLRDIWQQAESLYQQPTQGYYPGQTTAPFAPETEQALAMQSQRAQQGSPLTQMAKNYTMGLLGSNGQPQWGGQMGGGGMPSPGASQVNQNWRGMDFSPMMSGQRANPNRTPEQVAQLNGGNYSQPTGVGVNPYMGGVAQTASGSGMNPYLDSMYSAAARPVVDQFKNATAPSIASRFLKSGRYNSGAMGDTMTGAADVLGQNLTGMAANIYGSGYEAERGRQVGAQGQMAGLGESFLGRQQDAMQFAPQLAMQDYNDIGQLAQVGATREDLGERQIAENMNRWNYNQQQPANKLNQFLQFVQGNYGGQQTTQQPVYRNRAAGAAGGAMAGGATFGPWGAVAGGLLGYMGS